MFIHTVMILLLIKMEGPVPFIEQEEVFVDISNFNESVTKIFGGWWRGKCGSTVCGSRGRRLEEYHIGTGILTSRGICEHYYKAR